MTQIGRKDKREENIYSTYLKIMSLESFLFLPSLLSISVNIYNLIIANTFKMEI